MAPADRRRSGVGHRRGVGEVRLHRLQGERCDRVGGRRTGRGSPRRCVPRHVGGRPRSRRAAHEGVEDPRQAGHVGQPLRRQRSRVDDRRHGEARAVHDTGRPRPSGSSTTAPTANGGRCSSPRWPCRISTSCASSRSAPSKGWSPICSYSNGYPLDHIINLGDEHHSPPVETIVDRMIGRCRRRTCWWSASSTSTRTRPR